MSDKLTKAILACGLGGAVHLSELLEDLRKGGMMNQLPRCPECGGAVELLAGVGRTLAIQYDCPLPIPDFWKLPTCSQCGEQLSVPEYDEELDSYMEATYGTALRFRSGGTAASAITIASVLAACAGVGGLLPRVKERKPREFTDGDRKRIEGAEAKRERRRARNRRQK